MLKTKPLKKIASTDAIFANVQHQHALAKANPRILRISIDTKAKVKVGNLSRGGGKAVASNTKRFLERIVGFSQKINMPIQLVYYPPYHSKYNPIERVWAALENYWKPLILDTVENTINIAKQITWKGNKPIVSCIDKVYPLGITLSKEELEMINPYIQRNAELAQWDVLIFNKLGG